MRWSRGRGGCLLALAIGATVGCHQPCNVHSETGWLSRRGEYCEHRQTGTEPEPEHCAGVASGCTNSDQPSGASPHPGRLIHGSARRNGPLQGRHLQLLEDSKRHLLEPQGRQPLDQPAVTLRIPAALIALALVLPACGGGDDDGAGPSAASTPAGARCGVERWAVKTLSDDRAGEVHFAPQPATVDELRALPEPDPPMRGNEARRDDERQVYSATVALVRFKREDDRDVHLVVADPSDRSHTMIVELPDVACAGAIASAQKDAMRAAREAFEAACGKPTTKFRELNGTAVITGVLFFDEKHGQNGLAPNGVELHPLLSFASGDCARAN